MVDSQIRKIDFLKVFFRSFFLQSVWNYRSLISVGFDICLIPIVKRLYPNLDSRKEFLQRHLKFFNAHPYLASYALGISIKLEEDIALGNTDASIDLDRVKDLLISTLGAKGDRLFWLTIKPFTLIIGVLGIVLVESISLKVVILVTTFILYNIPHFYFRYIGLVEGYQFGLQIYKCLPKERFEELRKAYLYAGLIAFGLLSIYFLMKYYSTDSKQFLIFLLSLLYTSVVYKISKSFYYTTFLTFFFFLIVGLIFF
jgi:mannose/fructose/N-acetylgalactosamine-specific phosphotransferase system component IID